VQTGVGQPLMPISIYSWLQIILKIFEYVLGCFPYVALSFCFMNLYYSFVGLNISLCLCLSNKPKTLNYILLLCIDNFISFYDNINKLLYAIHARGSISYQVQQSEAFFIKLYFRNHRSGLITDWMLCYILIHLPVL
jgi:hypothetical protein